MDDHTPGIAVIESTSYGSSFAPCSIRWGDHPEKDGHDFCLVMLNDIDIALYEGEVFPIEYFAFEEKNKIVCFMKRPLTRRDDYLGPIEVKVYLCGMGYKSLKRGIDEMGAQFKNRWTHTFVSDWDTSEPIKFPERCALCLDAEDPPLEEGHGVGKCVPPPMVDYFDSGDESSTELSEESSTELSDIDESPPPKRARTVLNTTHQEYAHYCSYCNQLTRGYVCDTCLEQMENEYAMEVSSDDTETDDIEPTTEPTTETDDIEPTTEPITEPITELTEPKKGWFSWIW